MKIKTRRTNIMPEHLRVKKMFSKYGSFHMDIISRNMYGEYCKTEYGNSTITQSIISESEAEDSIRRGCVFYDALKDTEIACR